MTIWSSFVSLRRRFIYSRCFRSSSRLIILRYHSVGEPSRVSEYIHPGLSVSAGRFREQIRLLADQFQVCSLDEIPELLSQEPRNGTRLSVVITFDDGYRDNYEIALPILVEEGVSATFYVTTQPLRSGQGLWFSELWRLVLRLPTKTLRLPPPTAPIRVPESRQDRYKLWQKLTVSFSSLPSVQREEILNELAACAKVVRGEGLGDSFLTVEHLREMRKAGMIIGAHTDSHPHLDRLDASYHDEEVTRSRQILESCLGEPVVHFSYPNPGGGQVVCPAAGLAVQRAGFRTAVTSTAAPISDDRDLLCLPRIGVYMGKQEQLFFYLLSQFSKHRS